MANTNLLQMRLTSVQKHGVIVQRDQRYPNNRLTLKTVSAKIAQQALLRTQRIKLRVRPGLSVVQINMFRFMDPRRITESVPTRKQMVQPVQRLKNAHRMCVVVIYV